ncbi:RloB family protein [Nonomuraea guangzhouensis]|uniref:RloB family protein n=1 Tax=Nonomuraea guangzhouensis TaxID=1291555 RepID=A0ABW4G3N8_9ACTN|nr:RloB family protein [Nonomuraea guangzhouensis]
MAKRGAPGGATPPRPGQGSRRKNNVLFIVCEGQTERSYFHHLNHRYGAEHNFQIQLTPRKVTEGQQFNGYKPAPAVREAIRLKKSTKGIKNSVFWAVFDRDENEDIYEAFRLARQNGINVAFSHPHFELWLWLHFASGPPGRLGGDRTAIPAKLRRTKEFADFEKLIEPHHFEELIKEGRQATAVKLAQQLVIDCPSGRCAPASELGAPGHAPYCDILLRDPSTDIYRILEVLGIIS